METLCEHNWALNCEKRQKVWAKNFEFLENFWSFGEFIEYFGVFLERSGIGENFDISMSRFAQ